MRIQQNLRLLFVAALVAGSIASAKAGELEYRGFGPYFTVGGGGNSDIEGTAVQDLLDDPNYPNNPDWVEAVSAEPATDGSLFVMYSSGLVQYPQLFVSADQPGMFDTGNDEVDHGGFAVSFVFYAWTEGDYDFHVRSDDASNLYVSSNATRGGLPSEPSAFEPTCCNEFLTDGTRNTGPIHLAAGEGRLMEMIVKEMEGQEWFEVGVSLNGGPVETLNAAHCQRDVNAPGGSNSANSILANRNGITKQPLDSTIVEATDTLFFVEVDKSGAIDHQWQVSEDNGSTWNDIPGAKGAAVILENVPLASDGNQYRCMVDGTPSNAATLTVTQDDTAPTIVSAKGSGSPHGILITASESLDQSVAEDTSHYSIPGKTVSSAALIAPNQVLLDIGEYNSDPLTLTITGLTDRAANPNTIDPNPTVVNLNFATLNGLIFYFLDASGGLDTQVAPENRGNGMFRDDPSFQANVQPFGTDAGLVANFDNRQSGFIDYFEVPNQGDINVTPPNGVIDNYGLVINGFIVPTETADYTFFLAVDDNAEFYLSTDEDPANLALIAQEPAWNNEREWNGTGANPDDNNPTPEDQTNMNVSAPIHLVAGNRYLLEMYTQEGGGGDHAAVAWTTDGSFPPNGSNPIGNENLQVDVQSGPLTISQQPVDTAQVELLPVTFNVEATGSDQAIIGYQWMRNGVDVPGANQASWTFTATKVLDKAEISVRVFNTNGTFSTVTSETVILTVADDLTPPTLEAAYGTPLQTQVVLTFDEPLDPTTAQDAGNYSIATIDGGGTLGVTGATLLADETTVVLDTDQMGEGVGYEVTADGVTDTVGNGDGVSQSKKFISFQTRLGGLTFLHYDDPAPPRPASGSPGGPDTYPDNYNTFGNPFRTALEIVNSRQSGTTAWYEAPATADINTAPPSSSQDNYHLILFGKLVPQESGWYRFAISTDDTSALYLSTDESPVNIEQLAGEPQWNNVREYNGTPDDNPDDDIPPPNQSIPIQLEAGSKYWIESYSSEGGGGDDHSVTWVGPYATEEEAAAATFTNGQLPISGDYLESPLPLPADPILLSNGPTGLEIAPGTPITASIQDGLIGTVVDDSVTLLVDGEDTGAVATRDGDTVTISHTLADYGSLTTFTVTLNYSDSEGNDFSEEWTFESTFDRRFFAEGTRFIEVEDFNITDDTGSGMWIADANGGAAGNPYSGGAYAAMNATNGVDYNEDLGSNSPNDPDHLYRWETLTPGGAIPDPVPDPLDPPDLYRSPEFADFSSDFNRDRGTFSVDTNYKIGWTSGSDGFNFTRDFNAGTYNVYAAIASGSQTGGTQTRIGLVDDPTLAWADQTVTYVGQFGDGSGSGDWGAARIFPMHVEGDNNTPAQVTFDADGTYTIRWEVQGGETDLDFLAFVPEGAVPPGALVRAGDIPAEPGTGLDGRFWKRPVGSLTGLAGDGLDIIQSVPADATFTATTLSYTGNDLTPLSDWLGGDYASVVFSNPPEIENLDEGLFSFRGLIAIPEAGEVSFSTDTDDGSILWIGGEQIIDNDGSHGTNSGNQNGTATFSAAGLYPIEIAYYNGDWTDGSGNHGGATMSFTVNGTAVDPATLYPASTIAETLIPVSAAGAIPGEAGTGLAGRFWKRDVGSLTGLAGDGLDIIASVPPNGRFTATTLSYTGNDLTPLSDWLGGDYASVVFSNPPEIENLDEGLFSFTGMIAIPEAGTVDFATDTDDGSIVWIGGEQVIDNDGSHGTNSGNQNGTAFFSAAGLYPIEIAYYNGDWTDGSGNHGGATMSFTVNGAAVDTATLYPVVVPDPPASGPVLSISIEGTDAVVSWDEGDLQWATEVTGPYTDVGQSSPASFPLADNDQLFFRTIVTAPQQFTVDLNGANVRPNPVTTAATGSGTVTLDGLTMTVDVSYQGLESDFTNVHIHGPADTETAAGVLCDCLVPLNTPTDTRSGSISGTVEVDEATAQAIRDGMAYINIHTVDNGGGEIRGQILP